MTRLPAEWRAKLQTALASGELPVDSSSPGYDDVYDTFGELASALGEDWSEGSVSPARRQVAALVGVWETIPFDGVMVGVACNQPAVVAVAIKAASAMKLAEVASLLKQIQEHIPKEVLAMNDAGDRHDWYGSSKGKKHAAALEALEEKVNEGDFAGELLLGVFKRVLAEPDEFFET